MSEFVKTEMDFEEATAVAPYGASNAPAVFDEDERYIMDLTSERKVQFCSMNANTIEEKQILFKAQNTPQERLKDNINKTIMVKDVFVEVVQLQDQNTGEHIYAPRIVLIDTKGVGYQCVAKGVFSALKKIFNIFGAPTWEKGIALVPKLISKGTNNILTLDMPDK